MPQPSRRDILLNAPVEQIERLYRQGLLTAKQKNDMLHEKSGYELERTIGEKGYLGAIWAQSIKNLQQGWDNLKESATRTPAGIPTSGKDVKNELYYVGLAIWGQIQMLTSVMNAVGEVTGKVAEMNAVRAGASPGLAKAIGIAVDIGSGFAMPTGLASRSFAKGVQKLGAKAGGKAAQAGEQAVATEGEKVVQKVLGEALDADGVKGAEKLLAHEADTAGAKIIQQTEEAIAKGTPPSVAEQFAADLAKYRQELSAITETQTHEMTARLASKLGYTIDDLKALVPGTALDEKQMYAYLKALEPRIQEWQGLAENVVSEGSEVAVNAFAKYTSDLFSFMPQFRGAEVTAGRAVEILKEQPAMKALTDMARAWSPEDMANNNFVGAITTMAEDVLAMTKEAPERAQQLALQGQSLFGKFKDQAWPMIREGYINLLLARPITAVRNFLGNSIAGANAVAERFAGSMFSADKTNGLVATEAFALSKGMLLALGDGLKTWGKAFQGMDIGDLNKLDFVPGAIPGWLGRVMRLPGDNLRGMDNFFKTIFKRGSYYAQAIRNGTHYAERRGLKGDAFDDFVSDYVAKRVNNPTQAMLKEAEQFALNQTFQNELGTMGKTFQKGLQYGPLALWFPFMKTPINLAKYAWNRTPGLQLMSSSLYKDIAAGGVKADMAIGRLTVSNLVGMFLFEMAKDGMITGGGPVEPNLRRTWLATHKPYSVKTKDGWMPISNTEPASTTIGLIADFAQVLNQLDEPTAGQVGMALSFAIMKDLTDKTYWQGLSDLIDVGSAAAQGHSPGKTPMSVLLGPGIAVGTGGPLAAAVAGAMDPIKRETRTMVDDILNRIPGYSKTVAPDTDAYGNVILKTPAVGGPWLGLASPLMKEPYTEDRIKLEGDRIQAKIPDFPWTIGGKMRDDFDIRAPFPEDRLPAELTSQQRFRWKQIYRDMLYSKGPFGLEKNVLNRPEYQAKDTPMALKRELFETWVAKTRATARDLLLIEDKELGKKVLENKAAYVLPFLTPTQRAQAEPRLNRAITLFETMNATERANLLRWGTIDEQETEE